MCGTSLWSHSTVRLLVLHALQQSGQLVRLWCGTDVAQKQKPYTLESIHPTCLLSIGADTRQVCLFVQTRSGLGLFCLSFYGIVMVKCIFLMSCIAGETVPVGRWRCLFFLMCMNIGTISSNDFLLALF